MTGGALLVIGAIAVVDRIEGSVAVLEWQDFGVTEVPVELLPPGVGEGDRLLLRARSLPPVSADRGPETRPRGAARRRVSRAD